jgi:ketosteroid isomerase-like protein
MADDREELREANALFYRTLEKLDLPAMDGLWLHEGWVLCIHPAGDAVAGWESVRKSWEQIFANTRWIRVTPTDVQVEVFGEIGVVACSENISATQAGDVGLAVAQATNLYRKTAEGWRLFHHHASPAPVHVTQAFSGTAQ